jgi:tRNA nucleotidyltransferase (CCA-adding enzyme)
MRIQISEQVEFIIRKLTASGYEAYLVGGCVRDTILGKSPHDWDITTSALPQEIKTVLCDCKLIETGLKHGTITVVIDGISVEVTTYRIDGEYLDNRHPKKVRFTRSLKEDLARRDFTINALAYNQRNGLIDYFDGIPDIAHQTIRCVGEPSSRFQEDALRILRALRFSSVLGFSIEQKSSDCIFQYHSLLNRIARERIHSEFSKILCGENAESVLREYRMVFQQFLPEIGPMAGFHQNNPYHVYDVWEHTLKSISAVEPALILRLTMLLHDIGKPLCYTQAKNGVGHFYGHAEISANIAKKVLSALKYDSNTIDCVTELVKLHSLPLSPDVKLIKRRLNQLGENKLRLLLKVKAADIKAKNPIYMDRLFEINKIESEVNRIIEQNQCFSLKDLKVNGKDLLSIGIQKGPEVGYILSYLLNAVIDGRCSNDFDSLMNYTQGMKS